MFTYSRKNENYAQRMCRIRYHQRHGLKEDETHAILDVLQNCGRGWEGIVDLPLNEVLYNALMLLRWENSGIFPAHDLSLLTANTIMLDIAVDSTGAQLAVLDWQMLPAAILVAGKFSDIWLPYDSADPDSARGIGDELATLFPEITIHSARSDNWPLPEDSVFMGWDILAHCEKDPSFLERLSAIRSGIFITSQDFLGQSNNAHTRFLFLESGLLDTIVQLPLPKKDLCTIYPALIKLTKSDRHEVRFARASSIGSGPGSFDQAAIIALMRENSEYSIAIPNNAIARSPECSFMPATYFSKKIRQAQEIITKLGDCALVLRCQLPRQKVETGPGTNLEAGSSVEGRYIVHEIIMGDCDPISGFVDSNSSNLVSIRMSPLGNDGKYLLRQNDIIMPFRGGLASIGKPGFVGEDVAPSITGQGICIIRALPGLDPVWLYYYLQRRDCREYLQALARGTKLWLLNMQALRDLPIYSPDEGEVEAVNREYAQIAENMARILVRQRQNREIIERIMQMGEAAEHP